MRMIRSGPVMKSSSKASAEYGSSQSGPGPSARLLGIDQDVPAVGHASGGFGGQRVEQRGECAGLERVVAVERADERGDAGASRVRECIGLGHADGLGHLQARIDGDGRHGNGMRSVIQRAERGLPIGEGLRAQAVDRSG